MNMESLLKLEDLDVVREYKNVFPDDVPGVPPDRAFEFVIDVVPGNAPISKVPYRMTPAEMKELNNQLQELFKSRN